jgi:flagellar biosynthesis/type III secretory pathway chaperone
MSKTFQNNLKRLIQEETNSISCTIRDKRVLQKFKEEKEKTLMGLLEGNTDKRVTILMKEV